MGEVQRDAVVLLNLYSKEYKNPHGRGGMSFTPSPYVITNQKKTSTMLRFDQNLILSSSEKHAGDMTLNTSYNDPYNIGIVYRNHLISIKQEDIELNLLLRQYHLGNSPKRELADYLERIPLYIN